MKWTMFCYAVCFLGLVLAVDLGWAESLREMADQVPWGDKLCHLIFVGGLAFLLNMTLLGKRIQIGPMSLFVSTLALVPLMTVEEFSQRWLTNRTFSLADLACNYVAIVMFGWLAACWLSKSNEPQGESSVKVTG